MKQKNINTSFKFFVRDFVACAQERSRTSTPLRALAPEASASAIPPLGPFLLCKKTQNNELRTKNGMVSFIINTSLKF